MYCNQLILWLAIATSFTVYSRLAWAYIPIDKEIVRVAWSCINFTLFIASCYLCSIESLVEGYTKDVYSVGILVAMFVNGFLYSYIIPRLSYKMKFIDRDYGQHTYKFEQTKSNGSLLHVTIYLLLLVVVFLVENKQLNDYLFEKEPFILVQSWEKENYHGNTIYVVQTEKGTFGISPLEYPEIRNINPNTKIKVLEGNNPDNIMNYFRLEIQN